MNDRIRLTRRQLVQGSLGAVALLGWLAGCAGTITLATPAAAVEKMGAGGVSGPPVLKRCTEIVAFLHERLGKDVPIIGVGGIFSAEDAYAMIKAGASLVQVWTGLIYEGPGLVKKINKGLAKLLKRDGFANVRDAVGAAT